MRSLQIHRGNWKSSEDYPDLTAELIQNEIDQGWIFEFPGDEADAQQKYPCGVGLGKLGIAFSDSRPPRLILDSSVCNANQNCWIPETPMLSVSSRRYRVVPTSNQFGASACSHI